MHNSGLFDADVGRDITQWSMPVTQFLIAIWYVLQDRLLALLFLMQQSCRGLLI